MTRRTLRTLAVGGAAALGALTAGAAIPSSASANAPILPDGCMWNPFPSWTPSDAGYCYIDGQWWWFDWDGGYGTY